AETDLAAFPTLPGEGDEVCAHFGFVRVERRARRLGIVVTARVRGLALHVEILSRGVDHLLHFGQPLRCSHSSATQPMSLEGSNRRNGGQQRIGTDSSARCSSPAVPFLSL